MKDCTQKIFFIPVGSNEVLPSCSCHLINKTLCIVHNDCFVFCCVRTPPLFFWHVLGRLLTNSCGFLLCNSNLRYVTYTIIQQRRSRTPIHNAFCCSRSSHTAHLHRFSSLDIFVAPGMNSLALQ